MLPCLFELGIIARGAFNGEVDYNTETKFQFTIIKDQQTLG